MPTRELVINTLIQEIKGRDPKLHQILEGINKDLNAFKKAGEIAYVKSDGTKANVQDRLRDADTTSSDLDAHKSNASAHHPPVTLGPNNNVLLKLKGQELTLDRFELTGGGAALEDFVASGVNHARGAVPDPGAIAGTAKFLREDATWAVPPITSLLTYFLYATASDIGGYVKLLSTHSAGGEQNIDAAGLVDTGIVEEFATDANLPGLDFLNDGVWHLHVHALKTAGTKDAQLYFEAYTRTAGGVETLRATSHDTAIITGVDSPYELAIDTGEVDVATTDRVVIKIRAHVSGGGTAPTVRLHVEGTTLARIEFPGTQAAGSGAPGGANTQIQFNDGGVFGGSSLFTFIKATGAVDLTGTLYVHGQYIAGVYASNVAADPMLMQFGRARGTLGAPTAVGDGDGLANFDFFGRYGGGAPGYSVGASLRGVAKGAWSDATHHPAELQFNISPDSGNLVQAAVIDKTGVMILGGNSVIGQLTINAGSGNSIVALSSAGTLKSVIGVSRSAGGIDNSSVANDVVIRTDDGTSGSIIFSTQAGVKTAMVIKRDGKVAIGHYTPSELFCVYGSDVQMILGGDVAHTQLYNGYDAQTINAIEVYSNNGTYAGLTLTNNKASGIITSVSFANRAIGSPGTLDQRLAGLICGTDGATNSGYFTVATNSAGTFADRLKIDNTGKVSILTGALDMSSHLINNVTDPSGAQDAATKAYVDGLIGHIPSGTTLPGSPATGEFFLQVATGRIWLWQYDGSIWRHLISYGTTTLYVDGASGTDDTTHGTATGANALRTIQYALNLSPSVSYGGITINLTGATYAEDVFTPPIVFIAGGITVVGVLSTAVTSGTITAVDNNMAGNSVYVRDSANTGITDGAYDGKLIIFTPGGAAPYNRAFWIHDSKTTNRQINIAATFDTVPTVGDAYSIYTLPTSIRRIQHNGTYTLQFYYVTIPGDGVNLTTNSNGPLGFTVANFTGGIYGYLSSVGGSCLACHFNGVTAGHEIAARGDSSVYKCWFQSSAVPGVYFSRSFIASYCYYNYFENKDAGAVSNIGTSYSTVYLYYNRLIKGTGTLTNGIYFQFHSYMAPEASNYFNGFAANMTADATTFASKG